MKLYYSPTSPYARKVAIVAIETGHDAIIERVTAAPHPIDRDAGVVEQNPLGKVPTLVADGELTLFDSRVIAEYLDAHTRRGRVFPADGPARWTALTQQSLGDGLLDAALLVRYELTSRPPEHRWVLWQERQFDKIRSALARIDEWSGGLGTELTIGTITLACALGYLDLRFPEYDWRAGHPGAASWFAAISVHPSLTATRAPQPLAA
ncbi:glutathione S-transferase [Ancylobacter sp. 3268]|uniref:glutathione S-transferase n=1 Tax=Ancylobacter sp. 3268 TaxID=2817752 RepID=UPI0028555701|nr:glutathione S-transferase N-terminal domain-containing protein [Ancylobacter sp. 3268]MDR6953966.1 glutathione S-transferase [Ancylobacter sp. 3268]